MWFGVSLHPQQSGRGGGAAGIRGIPLNICACLVAQLRRLYAASSTSHAVTLPLASGLLLREAIEDLEWTGGEVEFVMRRSPMRFCLQSIKQQSLEVRAQRATARRLHGPACSLC